MSLAHCKNVETINFLPCRRNYPKHHIFLPDIILPGFASNSKFMSAFLHHQCLACLDKSEGLQATGRSLDFTVSVM